RPASSIQRPLRDRPPPKNGSPARGRASWYCWRGFSVQRARSVLDVELGAAVGLALALRQGLRGVLERTALAEAVRAHQARGRDAVAGQVVVHRGRTTLRQRLVVRIGAAQVGVASHLDAQVGVAL